MTTRLIFCEGPDDLNALRAVAQVLSWAQPVRVAGVGAGLEREMVLRAGQAVIKIGVPSKARGATGEGKSALARSVADNLGALRQQMNAADESYVSLVAAVFDPDDQPAADFHAELGKTIREHAPAWTLAESGTPGVWRARREAGEEVDVRAVHWRAPGGVLDGLPDHTNLERLLCAVLAKAHPEDKDHVARWLTEIGEVRQKANRKPATWKAAVHVWLALVYEKADELNAASRFLHQDKECRQYVKPTLEDVDLLADLSPLLGPD